MVHAVLVASPGIGHLIPMVELGKRLLTHHGFHVTIFVVTTDPSTTTSQLLHQTSNLNSLNIVLVPPLDVSHKLPPNTSLEARIGLTMILSLPFLRSKILSITHPPPSSLIVDIFGLAALPIARDLRMLTYVFFTTSAWFSAVTLFLPFMDRKMIDNHAQSHEPLFVPGCDPVRFQDTLESLLSPGGDMFEGYLKAAREIVTVDGILMNTWRDLEPVATRAVREHGSLGQFVYPVGPLVRTVEKKAEHAVLRWLDRQPRESVIYVSFGSGGTMSEGQMREVALGLELSQQRFVWVVRPPNDGASGWFFEVASGDGDDVALSGLPEGFAKRTESVGFVVPMWAPQAEILGHPATGGFVTHCGWNSVLESVMNEVPMVAWPLYAEQKMNAFMLSEKLRVAVRVAEEDGGVVRREQVAEVVRRVMVGEDGLGMRNKVKELKVSAEKALSVSGSSHASLSQITHNFQPLLQTP
ncbi:hypothetical protein Fmac_002477 [Flemingia macrophylla]|uniref:Glycosyltransferase n=1 Tax=Flemingia macrophylla TaxID=520843 RepID=A0ABD1NK12_9FABA